MKTYADCLQYLDQTQNFGIKLGLENIRIVLKALQDPHKRIPSVLVAGSNGKGSVCAMLANVLTRHGFTTGVYTSPHLIRYEERIRIGTEPILEKDFCRYLSRLREVIEQLIKSRKLASFPTHFELLTCLALWYFQEKEVDIMVLEVGMGGRFDATNIVTPLLSIITTISIEHENILGGTLCQIAFEKAGIIKTGVPVICGTELPIPRKIIQGIAQFRDAFFRGVFDCEDCFAPPENQEDSFKYRIGNDIYCFTPSLRGNHQARNAAVTIAAAYQLNKDWKKLNKKKIINGIETTVWEGRLEVLSHRPYIVVDGAHNTAGAAALKEYIQTEISGPIVLVFTVMSDKKLRGLAETLFPLADKIMLMDFPLPRAASPAEIIAAAPEFFDRYEVAPNIACCMEKAVTAAGENGAVICAGSLYLAGEVKKYFSISEYPNLNYS